MFTFTQISFAFTILKIDRKYLPVLKNMPIQYIHEPWTAPLNVQRAAKCIIGKDYSMPMVNHAIASKTNIQRMKQVYQQLAKYRRIENCKALGNYRDCYQPQMMITVGNEQN